MKCSTLISALLLLTTVTPAYATSPPSESPTTQQEDPPVLQPRDLLESADAERRQAVATEVQEFYDARDRRPAWLDTSESPDETRARSVIEALKNSSRHGLDPQHYRIGELERRLAQVEPRDESLPELDAELTAALLHYGSHLLHGRVSPEDVNRQWHTEPRQADLSKVLAEALTKDDPVEAFLDRMTPPHEEYQDLVRALDHLRTIADEGGWPEIPDGPVLEEGDSADVERLRALARRLQISGDLQEIPKELEAPRQASTQSSEDSGEASGQAVFTAQLAEALRRAQRRHGIRVDGKLGPNTLAALNVPVEARIQQVKMNLERWRWLPEDFGPRYVYVNSAAQKLTTYEGDTQKNRMAVVVGKEGWHTPVFTDVMERVVFHPYWNVPENIVKADLLPKIRENPSYLRENHFEVLSGWDSDARVIDPSTIDWSSVDLSDIRIRQRPGPGNALGQIKFLFPNQFNVYLHDTPAEQLFDEPDRAQSHGCVRVEKPVELAGFVFAETESWNQRRAKQLLERPNPSRKTVELDRELPVYMLYWTAFRDEDGDFHFLDDIYGHDQALTQALGQWHDALPSSSTKEASVRP